MAGACDVTLSLGRLRGQDGPVRCWRGVPYAQPPVGPLRWRAPAPVQPWAGVRDATPLAADPPQTASPWLRAPMGEDCLHLSIWSPMDAQDLPVMVWFFGGGFMGGSVSDPRTDGARLAAEGAVVVAVSYRVGLAGFLAHPALTAESETGSAGNWGLLDQLAALRWVQTHIAAFGGDPTRVTGFGNSAGAASLSLLLTLPEARGLLHRAILQSPGAFRRLATLEQAEHAGLAAGADIDALRALPWQDLLARSAAVAGTDRSLTGPRVLRPIRDGVLVKVDEAEAAQRGRFADIPLLLGSNADEGRYFVERMPAQRRDDFHERLRRDFGQHADEALALYGATSDADVAMRLAEVFGDAQFNWGTDRLAHLWAARSGAPAWRYLLQRAAGGSAVAPTHVDEVPYVFGTLADSAVAGAVPYDAQDLQLSQALRRTWVRFAATGRPGAADGGVEWPTTDAGLLALARDHHTLPDWRAAQMAFLDRVFELPR
jgi:para-nitrobenzyl esterase